MATLSLYVDTTWSTTEIGERRLPQVRKSLTLTEGRHVERTVDLQDGIYVTLDIGDIVTPQVWFFFNVHASGSIKIGFGSTDFLTLAAGMFGVCPSNLTPYAAGDGAASKLMYAVYA